MPVGIVVALPAEARPLSRASQPGNPVSIGADSLLMVSGMGAQRAGAAARTLIQAGATALASWGTVGGLDPQYRSGHLLVPKQIMTTTGETFATDPGWRLRVLQALDNQVACSEDTVLTTGQVLTSTADKRRLHAQSGAAAVDLESSVVAACARSAGVPFLALRCVADTAAMPLPGYVLEQVDPYGQPRLLPLLQVLLRYPRELATLWQLFMAFRAAQATLRRVRRHLGCNLLVPVTGAAIAAPCCVTGE